MDLLGTPLDKVDNKVDSEFGLNESILSFFCPIWTAS
jgi:hypothetical protein